MVKTEVCKMENGRVTLVVKLVICIVSRAPCLLGMARKSRMSIIMKPNTVLGTVHVISHLILSTTQ